MAKPVRIFLSWCHRDKAYKERLLFHLEPALGLFTDLDVRWWQDSHLTCGEQLMPGILDRLDESDFGLLLASPHYLRSEFIRKYELPRFAGSEADKGALPVKLAPLPPYGNGEHDLGGLEQMIVFERGGKSFAETTGIRQTLFANELAESIRRRILGMNGYHQL
jgi:hypothetical protein